MHIQESYSQSKLNLRHKTEIYMTQRLNQETIKNEETGIV